MISVKKPRVEGRRKVNFIAFLNCVVIFAMLHEVFTRNREKVRSKQIRKS